MNFILHNGDCLEVLRGMADNSVDSVVTDPPYGLEFMGKDWDAPWKSDRRQVFDGTLTDVRENPFGRSKVRYGQGASYGGQVAQMHAFQSWATEIFAECLRVLKPGGHLLSFGGSRTYHRMAAAVEDAGFEIRDQIMWVYGSGFPKSLDVSKAIDKAAGADREVIRPKTYGLANDGGYSGGLNTTKPRSESCEVTAPATEAARQWEGWGTALKPAHEPIVMARKPLAGTVAANVLAHGTGALNIDGCRVDGEARPVMVRTETVVGANSMAGKSTGATASGETTTAGRWPANLIHDGSDEVETLAGSAARFFYCAKASKKDREAGNNHPTVKPTDLMRYLCRLVTPPGGVVLDPFTGSGSTGKAAMLEGFRFIGIEREPEYIEIARARIAAAANDNTPAEAAS